MCSPRSLTPLGRVLVSSSRCIYENLALEEALLRRHDPESQGDLMLLWSNRPAVVIGRHQNPWVEADVGKLTERGIQLARRHSGGGTVYHDEGNLNISILTTQRDHCRKRNLAFLSDALNRAYRIQVVPTQRDDMEMQPGSRKCSGTAARIARSRAYHHMTLLVRADLTTLRRALRSPIESRIHSTSTRSVRAPAVGFLAQDDNRVTVEGVADTVIQAFRERFQVCDIEEKDASRLRTEEADVSKAFEELTGWEWIYGRTPKFEVELEAATPNLEASPRAVIEHGIVKTAPLEWADFVGKRFEEGILSPQ